MVVAALKKEIIVGSRPCEVSKETLKKLNWKSVIVKETVENEQLKPLLTELQQGDYGHTWRWFDFTQSSNISKDLYEFENKKRNTKIFYFYGITNKNEEVLFGAGTVSDKPNANFPFTGFPVIARSYIINNFRNSRLYFPMLKFRMDVCQELFGDQLRAIHLGSSNPRVFQTVKKKEIGIPFLFLGNENIGPSDECCIVRDFLWLTDEYRSQLENLVATCNSNSSGDVVLGKLSQLLNDFLANNNDSTFYLDLVQILDKLKSKSTNLTPINDKALNQLMTLMEEIPVTKSDTISEEEKNLNSIITYKRSS